MGPCAHVRAFFARASGRRPFASLRTRCCRRLEAPSSARLHRPHQRLHSEARHRLLDRRSADCRRLCGRQRPRDESVRRVGDSARRRYARLSACAPCRRQDALSDRTPPRRLYGDLRHGPRRPEGLSRRREARPLDEDPCRNRSHQRL